MRALGARIKGTNGESQGVVPFLKVVNDTAVAVNQGGKRKGAVCAYLETWHLDIEEFLELRKNTGDDRRRTHDMNTANWIPDLFMQRVMEKGRVDAVLARPTCPTCTTCTARPLTRPTPPTKPRPQRGEIKLVQAHARRGPVAQDAVHAVRNRPPLDHLQGPCNIRSPQQHVGVVHSSNLCTEITLNTSDSETAVCNLGSVNLAAAHARTASLTTPSCARPCAPPCACSTTSIDINYYAVDKARDSNLRHRPVGLGLMGFQDALYATAHRRTPATAAVEFADCVHGSHLLLRLLGLDRAGRGTRHATPATRVRCGTEGILPLDSLNLLEQARGGYVEVDRSTRLDWEALRAKIAQDGMRNSNCVAIAPTATISNIVGVDASIEPSLRQPVGQVQPVGRVHHHQRSTWCATSSSWACGTSVMVMDLKHFDGSLRAHRPRAAGPQGPVRHGLRGGAASGWWKPPRAARSGSTRRKA